MRTRKTRILLGVLVALMALSLSPVVCGQSVDDLVMVTGKANTGAAADLTTAEARKILLGETASWKNGNKIVVLMPAAGSAAKAAVLKKLCNMTEVVFTRYQMQAAFTGQAATTIQEVPSDAAVKAALHATPSAVGFVHKASVDATMHVLLELH